MLVLLVTSIVLVALIIGVAAGVGHYTVAAVALAFGGFLIWGIAWVIRTQGNEERKS